MEPEFTAARTEPLGVAAIQNLEDPSQELPKPSPAPEAPRDPLLDYSRAR